MRLGGNRALTLQVNAINLLNTVQWASVDTNVNSPTFGQVLSVRPMRTVTLMRQVQVLDSAPRDSRCVVRRSRSSWRRLPRSIGQQTPPAPAPPAPPVFRSSVNLVLVDVVVRDRSGAVVKGLTADDFELLEDGVRQQILTFAFEEITTNAAPVATTSTLSAAASASAGARRDARPRAGSRRGTSGRQRRPGAADVGRRRRPPAADAAVRHQLDAARGRAEGGRLGA